MILYLSSTQHTNLLDFTGFCEPDSEMPVKKLVGNFVLKQFVIYDMRSFVHFTDVVLDRPAFRDTDEEFAQAIREFLTMYSIRVTVICEGLTQADPLFHALLGSGVGNIVCDTEIDGIQQEIRECLSDQGMRRYTTKEKVVKTDRQERYRFTCKNVIVTVSGSQPRMGTTTAAIGLSVWLARVGASVCYVEANASGHLAALAHSYEMEAEEGGWQFEGVHYRNTRPQEDSNFVVCDTGSDFVAKQELLKSANIRMLVCGTKPYELPYTIRLQSFIAEAHAYLLCPFVAEGMKEDVRQALQNDCHRVMFPAYQPELTDSDGSAKQYRKLIAGYIAG